MSRSKLAAMIHVLAEAARNINSAVAAKGEFRWNLCIEKDMSIFKIVLQAFLPKQRMDIRSVMIEITSKERMQWLLNVVTHNWKVNANDRFGILLTACKDCIGDVCIRNEGP